MNMIVKEYDKRVKLGERKPPRKIVKVLTSEGHAEYRIVDDRLPYTRIPSEAEVQAIQQQLTFDREDYKKFKQREGLE